jgi:hypothetical protein
MRNELPELLFSTELAASAQEHDLDDEIAATVVLLLMPF